MAYLWQKWGLGTGDWGQGDKETRRQGGQGRICSSNYPMPNAHCPLPNSHLPTIAVQ
ncbi:hypothetical protein H6G81_17625 [Scytonema hofmannii FACHB-248]|uniref:Uncharacterized protein n=1 Tax=Scytonema hofmannii FACHB-248 TaxID=1842502 RepID=A0ABR8GSW6_9CYAN|nr:MULTISPECIES: hypothetical protein [Nostocales]MBD2606299.1 hypothetical protein [Scytonema hofmannii FACHB-248]